MLLKPMPSHIRQIMKSYLFDDTSMDEFTSYLAKVKQSEDITITKVEVKERKWCEFCRRDDHVLTECNIAPPKGTCFKCFEKGHRAEDPVCAYFKNGEYTKY